MAAEATRKPHLQTCNLGVYSESIPESLLLWVTVDQKLLSEAHCTSHSLHGSRGNQKANSNLQLQHGFVTWMLWL